MGESFLNDRVMLHPGDCLDVLARLEECSIDSCVCDPPYHLTSIVQRLGTEDAAPPRFKTGAYGGGFKEANGGTGAAFARMSKGFMGKIWDGGAIAFEPATWRAVYRVLKPGAHLVACGGTRTYHRMACAIEDAGFEIRDTISWLYSSGFPKSHNIGNGWGTALKPACELIVLARKPLSEGTVAANVLRWGTGAINVDGCRVATDESTERSCNGIGESSSFDMAASGERRINGGSSLGRWPANVAHDGSDEVVAAFPDGSASGHWADKSIGFDDREYNGRGKDATDSGSAARFFYTSKADADDRLGSKHPTVKPLDLMQWLVRMVTPPKGIVLDPFSGTGTTGEAAWREGMRAVLIEAEPEYQADIRRRMALALAGPDERSRESVKAKNLPVDYGPLFGFPEAAK